MSAGTAAGGLRHLSYTRAQSDSDGWGRGPVNRFRFVVAVAVVVGVVAVPSLARAGEPVWGKEMVEGKDFPLPFGVSAVYFTQDQDYVVDKLTLGVPGLPLILTGQLKIENSIDEVNAKLDAWLLPWLNVFAIAGQLDGETTVNLGAVQQLLQLPFGSIRIDYDGEVYGVGAVLAGGSERFFGSLTTIATETSLSGDFESDASAFVVTPRLGVHNRRGALYVGSMYQAADEKHEGTIALPLGPPGAPVIQVPFEVELSQKDDWNWLVGGTAALGERWTLQVEGGFGDRDHVDVEIGFRF
jgi:hypothetical protein